MKKFSLSKLFTTTITTYLTKINSILDSMNSMGQIKILLELILNNIMIIAKFMLDERFTPSTPKEKRKGDNMNPDLKKFLGLIPMVKEISPKKEELNLLDVIKFFKILENFMLKREWLSSIKDLRLGQFRIIAEAIIDNLPTLLLSVDELDGYIKELILNCLFSAITIYRQFKVKSIPDTSTISGEYTGSDLNVIIATKFNADKIRAWLINFLANFNVKGQDIRLVMYSGNASSPNSGASTNNLYNDVAAVAKDNKLWNNIIVMAGFFKNGDDLIKLITGIKENISIKSNVIHSRLFNFTAQGGKARIIANVDWVTQTALSAIHFTLFAILKTIASDFTFNHKGGIDHVLKAEKIEGYNYYSIDLSAATDRLPRVLQALLIAGIFDILGFDGKAISKSWLAIVDRTFSTEGTKLNEGKPIRYTVGQGMGIFTSFPVLGIMHHFIVNCLVGIPMSRYCIVGDDLLFYGTKEEYYEYLEFMKSIGVTVNPGKTIVSQSAEKPNIEFARNFIIQGIKIKPIPIGVLFAWNDSKVTFETVAWAFLGVMNFELFFKIIKNLGIELSIRDLYSLGYYIFKHFEIDFVELYRTLQQFGNLPIWFTLVNLKKITEIVSFGNDNLRSESYINSEFMASYNSACIVRHKEEIERNHLIANSIAMLAIVDKSLIDISEAIADRLINTDLIAYDVDLKAGPILSKRERNLLELIDQANKPK